MKSALKKFLKSMYITKQMVSKHLRAIHLCFKCLSIFLKTLLDVPRLLHCELPCLLPARCLTLLLLLPSRSVVSDSVRPHRWQPSRLPRPWDSPGKNTGVGCHFLLQVKVKSLSRVRLLATPWTAAHQAPPSMGFSRQEYWSGVPLPSPVLS